MNMPIFVGFDEREKDAYEVCEYSLRRHSSKPLEIEPISSAHPLYKRNWHQRGNDRIDDIDGYPFSTDFSFARFLVPAIMDYKGWAMFVDCDFLFRGDIQELFERAQDRYAVMCVKHNFRPNSPIKMDGVRQSQYFRKCWSSMVLWNCGHAGNKFLTPEWTNHRIGGDLHKFIWLYNHNIGDLPEEWNWLEGHSSTIIDPKAIHYTEGGPWFWNRQNVHYAKEWKEEQKRMKTEAA